MATLALAGCSLLPFGNDDPTTGGSDGSGTSQNGSDGEGSGDDTGVISGSGQLPASWPDEVFVPADAEVVSSVDSPGSWFAQVHVADVDAAFAEVSTALKTAGFTATSELVGAGSSIGVYTSDQYQLQLFANTDDGTPSLYYTISEKG